MIKNITIALLIGVIVGQTYKADTAVNVDSITRRDLFTAAALCGIIANSNSNPLGWKPFPGLRNNFRSQNKFVDGANHYADLLMKFADPNAEPAPSQP